MQTPLLHITPSSRLKQAQMSRRHSYQQVEHKVSLLQHTSVFMGPLKLDWSWESLPL